MILRLEMKNCNMVLSSKNMSIIIWKKNDKYEYFTREEILFSNQREKIEQVKFPYSPLGKAFVKQTKPIEKQGRKQIDDITNQNERLSALTNKGDHKDNHKDDYKDIYKEIFDKPVKEKFDEIK